MCSIESAGWGQVAAWWPSKSINPLGYDWFGDAGSTPTHPHSARTHHRLNHKAYYSMERKGPLLFYGMWPLLFGLMVRAGWPKKNDAGG